MQMSYILHVGDYLLIHLLISYQFEIIKISPLECTKQNNKKCEFKNGTQMHKHYLIIPKNPNEQICKYFKDENGKKIENWGYSRKVKNQEDKNNILNFFF